MRRYPSDRTSGMISKFGTRPPSDFTNTLKSDRLRGATRHTLAGLRCRLGAKADGSVTTALDLWELLRNSGLWTRCGC